ncbi:ABC transporter permease, partial [Pseudomonas stutzeri]|nr:ABC transporter permease [Stutzerimonas stutzeri]
MNTLSESVLTALQLIVGADPVLLSIVVRSLAVSACACLLACSAGMGAGSWLAVARFRGRGIVRTVLNTSLA